jgi:hypothetical protein
MNEHYLVFVNAGVIVLLARDMSDGEKLDVLNSVLFAQLVANKKCPGFAQVQAWYDTYREVLKNGWLQREAAWRNFPADAASTFKFVDQLKCQMEDHVDPTTVDEVIRVLDGLAQLPVTLPAIDVLRGQVLKLEGGKSLETTSGSGCKVRLQVIIAQSGPMLHSFYMEFETTEQVVSNPLGQVFRADNILGNIQLNYFQANLSAALYEPLRDAVIKKMGGQARENIFQVSGADGSGLLGGDF